MTQLRTAPEPTDRRPVVVLVLAAAGVLAGVAAKAADESGVGWAADLGTFPAAWVLAVAAIGRFAPTWRAAAVRASVFFAAMTAAYYGWAVRVLGFGYDPGLVLTWLVLSATAVAAVAAVSWEATRRRGPLPGALLALVAGTALAGGALRNLSLWWSGASLLLHPVEAGVEVAVALAVTLAVPRHAATRLWAVVLVVPMWWLAGELLDRLYGAGVIR
jgi:hypothetical protein